MGLLEIENLTVDFETGEHIVHAVKNISLSIHKGEMFALVGESGSGKSVTAHSILKLLPPSATVSGQITFRDNALNSATDKILQSVRGSQISMVFQEPMSALNPLHTIGRQIREMITLHQKLSQREIHERVLELLEMVGLQKFKDRLDAYPHQLSGGERQRVMIAMAMANSPDLIIADEPTTALDVTLQTQILSLLKKLQKENSLSILLITHDLTIVKRLADRVAIMQHGEIVEQGDTKTIFANAQHAYTKKLLSSEPKGSALPLPKDAKEIIRSDDLRVHFPINKNFFGKPRGYVKAVDGIDISIKEGQTIGIVGESGSGKTTMGLALIRLIQSKGNIVFLGKDIHNQSHSMLRHFRDRMQIVFQDPYASLNPRMSIGEIIAEGLKVHKTNLSERQREDEVKQILERVGLEAEMMDRYPHEFSGGQRQRISIARAMILKPQFVVLDEPTSALDLTVQTQILDLLKLFQKEDHLAYIFISHDLRVIRAISHEVMVMKSGQVIEHQPTETLFTSPKNDYTKALIDAAFIDAA